MRPQMDKWENAKISGLFRVFRVAVKWEESEVPGKFGAFLLNCSRYSKLARVGSMEAGKHP
jgi:hypothetical protein